MEGFLQAFNRLSLHTDAARQDLQRCLRSRSFEKGDCLLKSGAICRNLYFLDSGLVKTGFTTSDKTFIMRFFPENNLFTVLDSFTTQAPSIHEIVALEPTTVTYIGQADLDVLCRKHHCTETAFRKLLAFATMNMMKRISEMLEENATERYNHFLKDQGALLQRISLGDLANYLGIAQVSLSRIRGKK